MRRDLWPHPWRLLGIAIAVTLLAIAVGLWADAALQDINRTTGYTQQP